MTRSIERPLCDSWASCSERLCRRHHCTKQQRL